jgi:RES domain-containing protein
MDLWRLSHADYAERFDGGYGLVCDGRWNGRGRPVTCCSTGPALCVLEKLVHIDDAALLPDEMMLMRYDAPDALNVEEIPLDRLPDRWRMSRSLTMAMGNTGWTVSRRVFCASLPSSCRLPTPATETS